jgi:hypothetical protein
MRSHNLKASIAGILRSPRLFVCGVLANVVLAAVLFVQPRLQSTQASPSLRIAVAEWRQEGGPSRDLQSEVYDILVGRLAPLGLAATSVIQIPEAISNAEAIDAVAAKYGVDMVVWGWYDQEAVWSYVDLARATDGAGRTNSLAAFLERGGHTEAVRVLQVLSAFDYDQDGAYFCVPRWSP